MDDPQAPRMEWCVKERLHGKVCLTQYQPYTVSEYKDLDYFFSETEKSI